MELLFMKKIDPKLKELIKNKMDNFKEFIIKVSSSQRKKEIESLVIKSFKIFMFIIMIDRDKMDKQISEFISKFEIADEHRAKIEDYYLCFLTFKDWFLQLFIQLYI